MIRIKNVCFLFKDQTEEAGEGSVLSVSESVPESEREMKPRKEMFDSRVVIDETRVIYEKYSCENQHFKMSMYFIRPISKFTNVKISPLIPYCI